MCLCIEHIAKCGLIINRLASDVVTQFYIANIALM